MIEHSAELFPGHIGVGVHHLKATDAPHKLLHPPGDSKRIQFKNSFLLVQVPGGGLRLEVWVARHAVHPDINTHLLLVSRAAQHPGLGGQLERTQPDRVDLNLLLEQLNGSLQVGQWYQHVLQNRINMKKSFQSMHDEISPGSCALSHKVASMSCPE